MIAEGLLERAVSMWPLLRKRCRAALEPLVVSPLEPDPLFPIQAGDVFKLLPIKFDGDLAAGSDVVEPQRKPGHVFGCPREPPLAGIVLDDDGTPGEGMLLGFD